ncbi:HNH endonuclease family protein [Litorilituus lipolyticus]|uniref:HNH endonuclease n=1 Tax=Litorilituus lipolyticus TaxID=2491017 RepID=A0A502L5U6_9GAMM|nr:HNH endonuclease family protein [Litorilituus lipolyticus]TPH18494.1 HNH endonuclease [Litorilituus lipolyticus]
MKSSLLALTILFSTSLLAEDFSRKTFPHWVPYTVYYLEFKRDREPDYFYTGDLRGIPAFKNVTGLRFTGKHDKTKLEQFLMPEDINQLVRAEGRYSACRLDTRQYVLVSQGRKVVVRKADKGNDCKIFSGEWVDYYSRKKLTDPSLIDIDHVVPLKEAWDSGANEWPVLKRLIFANDPRNLVITSAGTNRSKSSSNMDDWLPDFTEQYTCYYINKYSRVKHWWGLTFEDDEIDVVEDWEGENYETSRGKSSECRINSVLNEDLFGTSLKETVLVR